MVKAEITKRKPKTTTKVAKKSKVSIKPKLIPRRKLLRRSRSAWVFFSSSQRAKTLKENPGLSFGAVSQLLSPIWQSMSEEEKKPYYDMYIQDKQRYIKDNQSLSPDHRKMLRQHIRSKNLKKKGRPSPVLSSYMLFVRAKHKEISAQHPTSSFLEVGKIMGDIWRGMSEYDKQPYSALHEQDKQRFINEMKAYAK